jgi:hypothetical protein
MLIYGNAAVNNKSTVDLSVIIGCTPPTMYARLKHPENFTLNELSKIGLALHIPIEELRQCITY